MSLFDQLVDLVLRTGFAIYTYCTDFVINVANLTGLSYYEINAILFCFLFPAFLLATTVIYFVQGARLRRLANSPKEYTGR